MSARQTVGDRADVGMKGIEWSAFSEAGPGACQNEDYVICDTELGLFLVADGMGGRPGGEVASKVGAEVFAAELRSLDPQSRLDPKVLQEVVSKVNAAIQGQASENQTLQGMGTTLSALIIAGSQGRIVHIGDSRVYLWQRGHLSQLTHDHTLVQELVQRNHLSPADAKEHPMRHVLARTLGGQSSVDAEILAISLLPADMFILATDGLGTLPDATLERILSRRRWRMRAPSVAKAIRKAALGAVPDDDVSVIVAVAAGRQECRGGFIDAKPSRRGLQMISFAARAAPAEAWKGKEGTSLRETIAADIEVQLQGIAEIHSQLECTQKEQHTSLVKRFLRVLEVLDAFEHVFENVEEKKDLCTQQMNIWVGNFRTVYKLLRNLLQEEGIVPVENLDQGFDPRWHEAVDKKMYDPERPEGTIVKEERRGYLLHGQLLRRTLVVVTTQVEQTEDHTLELEDEELGNGRNGTDA